MNRDSRETRIAEETVHDEETVGDGVRCRPLLIMLTGLEAGRVYRLGEGDNVIGRGSDAQVLLDDDGISRAHCSIFVGPDSACRVSDLGSTNGTRLNGTRLSGDYSDLADGDQISLGKKVVFKYAVRDEVEESVQRQLYNTAVQDPMTGAYNRGYLAERFKQEFSFAQRHDTPLSMLVFDLDHFKQVNDTWGHAAGDTVLVATAKHVMASVRPEDVVARYGGEEFVVLMRDTPIDDAATMAQRIRQGIEALRIDIGQDEPLKVTASIGVVCTSRASYSSPEDMFGRCDALLYEAKRAGRNRVVVAG